MTCKRCEDIHLAQRNGKTTVPCKCDCHNVMYTTSGTWLTNGTATGDGFTLTSASTSDTINCGQTPAFNWDVTGGGTHTATTQFNITIPHDDRCLREKERQNTDKCFCDNTNKPESD